MSKFSKRPWGYSDDQISVEQDKEQLGMPAIPEVKKESDGSH